MELKVVIDKKFAFMIFVAILILAGAIYGYAYGGNTPSVMGHSFEEVEGVQARVSGSCSAGSSIRAIDANGGVTCETDNIGSVPGVTTKTYGPYSTQTNINLGSSWKFCSLGGISTGRENHGATVWKAGSNWYAGSTGFSDAAAQSFWVNCWRFS